VPTTPHRKNVSLRNVHAESLGPGLILQYDKATELQEVGCGGIEWTELAQDRNRWQALVNVVMNLWVP